VQRADFRNRLDWPFPVGPVQIDPFGEARNTVFSTTVPDPGDGAARNTFTVGATATTDAWGEFHGQSDVLSVTGFRHIFTPSAGYVRVVYNDVDPVDLFQIDQVEQVVKTEYVPLSLRNRIQGGRADATVDLVDLLIQTRYFPRSRWAAPQEGFFLEDAFTLTTAQTGIPPPTTAAHLRNWDVIATELRITPADFAQLYGRSDWDPLGPGLVRSDLSVLVRPDPALSLIVNYNYFKNLYQAVLVGVDLRATEKWGFFASSQYDFQQGAFLDNRVAVRRYFHRFVLEGAVNYDGAQHEWRVSATFSPIELFRRQAPFGNEIERGVEPMF
jgi:hypothetical protein